MSTDDIPIHILVELFYGKKKAIQIILLARILGGGFYILIQMVLKFMLAYRAALLLTGNLLVLEHGGL